MATYQTRHLEAVSELHHDGRPLNPGDRFRATEVDAEYLVRIGRAKIAQAPAAAPAAVPAVTSKKPAAKPADAPTAIAATIAKRPGRTQPVPPAPPEPAPTPPPVAVTAPAPDVVQSWERTEPIKLADVPHPDLGTPAKE